MTNDPTTTAWPFPLIAVERATTEQAGVRTLADWTRMLAEGDDEAWRWFHAGYYIPLLRYAAQRSGDVSAAGEIVQQAYLRIARHAKPFATEKDFSNWLFCVVRCAALDHTRHRTRRSLLAERYAHWRASQAISEDEWHSSASQTAALAHEALARLPAADSELLRRKYCEGITTDELADELGTTSKVVEHRLARLRGLLREIILRIQ